MLATRDFIPEELEARYPAQTRKTGAQDWVPPTPMEALRSERWAIEKAIEQGLRPASDLDEWKAAHPDAVPARMKTRAKRVKALAEAEVPKDETPELHTGVGESAPDPWQFGPEETDGTDEDQV